MLPTPGTVFREVDSLISFLWKGKTPKISRVALEQTTAHGGIGLHNFPNRIKAAKLNWLKRLACSPTEPWQLYFEFKMDIRAVELALRRTVPHKLCRNFPFLLKYSRHGWNCNDHFPFLKWPSGTSSSGRTNSSGEKLKRKSKLSAGIWILSRVTTGCTSATSWRTTSSIWPMTSRLCRECWNPWRVFYPQNGSWVSLLRTNISWATTYIFGMRNMNGLNYKRYQLNQCTKLSRPREVTVTSAWIDGFRLMVG